MFRVTREIVRPLLRAGSTSKEPLRCRHRFA